MEPYCLPFNLWGKQMFKPRFAISVFALAISMIWLPGLAQAADQPFQRFLPLLVDLSGWDGKKPDGPDTWGASLCLIGAAIIMYWPRK